MKIAVDFVMDIIKNEDTELYKTIKNDICALKQYTTAKKNDAETKANINLYDIITEYGMQLCEIKEQEKNKRAEIHAIVKKHPLFAAKTTSDNTIIIKRVKTNRTYMMTMKKTYKDTITACNIIASALKIPFNKVSFAGNKDKRAITYQKITIEGCSFAKIMELAVKLKKEYKSIAIFDVKQCNSSIKLGELEGNKFDIRIRQINDENAEKNIQTCEEYIECNNEQQLQSEKINNNNWIDKINPFVLEQGFINYYGQQRFGKNYNNHLIGEFIVNGEYEKVIDMIMSINQYDSDKIKEAKQQFENEQYETATKLMPFACNVEKSICIGKKKATK
ncbi:multisubstrate pseudouridine synthase 7 [Binucleata daphniae]